MKLLVTGSSGLIGSEVCVHFGGLGWEIHGFDNNQRAVFFGPQGDTRWNQGRLTTALGTTFHHHELDIRDRSGILALLALLLNFTLAYGLATRFIRGRFRLWLESRGKDLLTISQVYVPRDRRTFYEAETKMRTLFSSALNESVRPHLEGNARLIEGIEARIDEQAEELGSKADHYRNRAASLKGWTDKSLLLLPLLDKLFSLPAPLFPFNLFGKDSTPDSGKSPTPPDPGHS